MPFAQRVAYARLRIGDFTRPVFNPDVNTSSFLRTRSRFVCAAVALSVALSSLHATVVSYTVSGKITSVLATKAVTDEFPEGADWSAVVSWETSSPTLSLNATQAQYRMTEFKLTLAGVSGPWTSSAIANGASFTLNYEPASDLLQFTSGWGPASLTNGTIKDMQPYSFNVVLSDPTKAAISTLTPAPSSLSLSDWSSDETKSHLKFYLNNDANRSIYGKITSITVTSSGGSTSTPTSQAVAPGASATLTTAATGTIQWQHNGAAISGATSGTLSVSNVQPASAGIYTAVISDGGTTTTQSAILGVSTTSKVIGAGSELPANVTHPNGKIYDPLSLTGAAATLTADSGQATRISFIDLNDDIVQVEFAGAGTLSLVLDAATGPAAPAKYNQSNASYMKGHAGIVITGADETTNVSIFSVGRLTAFDPTGAYDLAKSASATNDPARNGNPLFTDHASSSYDGVADLAFVAIQSSNGKFGGLRAANAGFFAAKGFTGIYAPDVTFTGPLFIHDVNASDTATPVLLVGSVSDARITGGNLKQDNSKAVQITGLTQLKFADGTNSHNTPLPAQANAARLEDNGTDVTAQVVVNPTTSGAGKELTYFAAGTNPPYAMDAKKSFEVTATTLKFDSTTLTNPVQATQSNGFTSSTFTDAATGLVWEVSFKDGVLHEINLSRNGVFVGQWS